MHRKKRYLVLLLCAAAAIGGIFWLFFSQKPRFHDLTVELGTPALSVQDFQTEYAESGGAVFLSDPGKIDLGRVGTTEVTLRQGFRTETVTLTVADTTAPEARVEAFRCIPITGFPEAGELVSGISDASEVSVFYKEEPFVPLDYRDIPVTVVLEDAWGNRTEKVCQFSFRWMPETVILELGREISDSTFLYNPLRDAGLLDPMEMMRIRAGGIGEYTVTTTVGEQTQECILRVQDTLGPELTVRDVQVRYGGPLKPEDFVESAEDPSGIREIRLLTEVDTNSRGSFPVVVEAEDRVGNITRQEAVLYVATDFVPPKITGLMTQLVLEKNAPLPDLLEGIGATDNIDGSLPVECDISGVNLNAGGTYYIVYRATDSSGNVVSRKRQIVILHDEEDTAQLVRSIADMFADDDVEGMLHYVYYGIGYNHDWGEDDPVWYGLALRKGNCYVHALSMKALLDAKGIENQLIWTTDQSHYWLIVKFTDGWKHIEPTPSIKKVQTFMNDAQRRATLSGRKWDTTQWPACP